MLPLDIMQNVTSYLPLNNLPNTMLTCRRFRNAAFIEDRSECGDIAKLNEANYGHFLHTQLKISHIKINNHLMFIPFRNKQWHKVTILVNNTPTSVTNIALQILNMSSDEANFYASTFVGASENNIGLANRMINEMMAAMKKMYENVKIMNFSAESLMAFLEPKASILDSNIRWPNVNTFPLAIYENNDADIGSISETLETLYVYIARFEDGIHKTPHVLARCKGLKTVIWTWDDQNTSMAAIDFAALQGQIQEKRQELGYNPIQTFKKRMYAQKSAV